MNWFEDLPDNCPPSNAEEPNGGIFYRLCKDNPSDTSDFYSQRKEDPDRKFYGISECILRSVSIWDDKDKCLSIKKFPTNKNKVIGEFRLDNTDGLIKKTFKKNHYSWWRSNSFNPETVNFSDS